MAATNFTPIQLYFSTTASAVPTAANLAQGELAINITDGKLYYEDNSGAVQVIATKGTGTIGGSTTQIQYNNAGALAGSSAMTFNSGTSTTTLTTLNLTNALGAIYGGTAQSTYAQGDIVYASAANTLAKLGIGASTFILTSNGTIPQWVAPSSISVLTATNLAGGAAGSVPYQSGVATTTFLTIGAANTVMTSSGTAPQWVTSLTGLTGVSSSSITNTGLTSGRVVFSTTGGLETDSANLTFSGSALAVTGTLSATGAVTFTGTTATLSGTGLGASNNILSVGNSTDSDAQLRLRPNSAERSWSIGASTLAASTLTITPSTTNGGSTFTTPVISISSTGLAVTGTLSATGTLSGGTSGTGYSFSGSAPATSLTLDSSGNLGIGTSSPGVKLDVNGNATVRNTLNFNQSSTTYALMFGNAGVAGIEVYQGIPLTFATGAAGTATEKMRLDNSGNLGLGVTPSAQYNTVKALQVGALGATIIGGNTTAGGNSTFGQNWYADPTTALQFYAVSSYYATSYHQVSGEHRWFRSTSAQVAGTNTAMTQEMTLDSSGRLGIGTTSPSEKLQLEGSGSQYMRVKTTTTNADIYFGITSTSVGYVGTGGSDPLSFVTGGTERARIDSSGRLLVGTTDTSQSSGIGTKILPTGACYTVGTGIDCFSYYNTSASQYRLFVGANGGISNFSANNANLSDRREKTNFTPAKSYLDVICAIPVQTYNYINQDLENDGGLTLGVVAQDVQAVAPELVTESNWAKEGDEPKMRLSIYQTDLQYALMKCIQEQQALITQLTARITALETP